jgi:hypothetical protein
MKCEASRPDNSDKSPGQREMAALGPQIWESTQSQLRQSEEASPVARRVPLFGDWVILDRRPAG